MASRKPLVLSASGRLEQLQSGDSLNATVSEVDAISLVADATLIAGQVVYPTTSGHIGKAKADAAGTAKVLGLTTAAVTSGASGSVQTNGVVVLTTGEWDAAFGTTGGLTVGTYYYLSAGTAGLGTATAPSTVSQLIVQLGLAISTTELYLDPQPEILL
jgi:hypothetical protein